MNAPETVQKVSLAEALKINPLAVDDIKKEIRSSRSVHKDAPLESFIWEVHRGRTWPYPDQISRATIRLLARKDRLVRCSNLYDEKGNLIEGNWSF